MNSETSMFRAGLDDSGAGMTFAVTDQNGTVLFDEFIPHLSRTTANLPQRMADLLSAHQLGFQDIAEWSVGAGPGSFTGLRIASAFVMGLAFGKSGSVRTRCVSTSAMIAAAVPGSPDRVLILFDGRKKELLAYGMKKTPTGYREDGFYTVIRTMDEAQKAVAEYDAAAAPAGDHETVKALYGGLFAETVFCVDRPSAAALIAWAPDDFSRPLTDLLYLRPAVFVEPQKLRSVE